MVETGTNTWLLSSVFIYIYFAKTDIHTVDSKAAEMTRSTADGGGRQHTDVQRLSLIWGTEGCPLGASFYGAEMEPEGHRLWFQSTAGYRSLLRSLPLGSLCFCVTAVPGRVEGDKTILLLYVYIGREPVRV